MQPRLRGSTLHDAANFGPVGDARPQHEASGAPAHWTAARERRLDAEPNALAKAEPKSKPDARRPVKKDVENNAESPMTL